MNLTLKFAVERFVLPISVDLQDALNWVCKESGKVSSSTQAITINVRNSTYSIEGGGITLSRSVSLGLMTNGLSITSLILATVD